LAELGLAELAADIGPLLVTGSFVSGLMCWPELDVMVLVGGGFSPPDVMGLLARIVRRAGVTGLEYRDERGPRCATGQVRDERYHVPITVERAGRCWQVDLTLWLHDLHETSHAGMKNCASGSPLSSARRCCASKTTGTAACPIRTRWGVWRSTPRSSRPEQPLLLPEDGPGPSA
jgi:hypothetical protein